MGHHGLHNRGGRPLIQAPVVAPGRFEDGALDVVPEQPVAQGATGLLIVGEVAGKSRSPRQDRRLLAACPFVGPLTVEGCPVQGEMLHPLVRDGPPCLAGVGIQPGLGPQSLFRHHRPDQMHHDLAANRWTPPTVLHDMTAHPMLDPVPSARPGQKVAGGNPYLRFVRKSLQLPSPAPTVIAVRVPPST